MSILFVSGRCGLLCLLNNENKPYYITRSVKILNEFVTFESQVINDAVSTAEVI